MAGKRKPSKSAMPRRPTRGSEPGVRTQGAKRNSWEFALAHEMWTEQCASIDQVADACAISRNTLLDWRQRYDWDVERRQAAQGWGKTLLVLRQALGRATERLTNDRGPAAIGKTLKTIERILDNASRIRKLERDVDYRRFGLRFVRDLTEYLAAQDMKALEALEPHVKPFTNRIARG
jgi:transposase